MKNTFFTSLILLFILISCDNSAPVDSPEDITDIKGISWLLVETGYSPGAGYVVEPVNTNPAQIMVLGESRSLQSTVEGLEKYKFYLVLDDPDSDADILAMYENDPGNTTPDISTLAHSYYVSIKDNDLVISYRYCIEGCHLRFVERKTDR